MAFSMSPLASTSAGAAIRETAFVLSRSSFTSCAGICTAGCCVLILFSLLLIGNFLLSSFAYKTARTDLLGAASQISTRAIALAFFLVVGRNGGFRRLGGLDWRFDNALYEVAFLLFVLFVRAGIDVLDAVHQRLVFRGFLFRHLRLPTRDLLLGPWTVLAIMHGTHTTMPMVVVMSVVPRPPKSDSMSPSGGDDG